MISIQEKMELSIKEELYQDKFKNRTHGTLTCYNKGCRGEMCKRARRLWHESHAANRTHDTSQITDEHVDWYIAKHKAEKMQRSAA